MNKQINNKLLDKNSNQSTQLQAAIDKYNTRVEKLLEQLDKDIDAARTKLKHYD